MASLLDIINKVMGKDKPSSFRVDYTPEQLNYQKRNLLSLKSEKPSTGIKDKNFRPIRRLKNG